MTQNPDPDRLSSEELLAPFRRVPKDDWLMIGWVMAVKLLLFIFGVKSFQILENRRFPNVYGLIEIWKRWDSLHYLKIAQFGYSPSDTLELCFYPLFPWSLRLFASLTGDYFVSGLLVSGLALVAVAILLRRLARIDYAASVARRAVWFLLIFPTAYFLHIAYTESLFLAFALGSILAARRERWWLAGTLGALSSMTRANGVVLVPTLAVEAAHQYWTARRWNWRWLWILIVPAGLVVYLLINWKVTGDSFTFLGVREKLFVVKFSWPWIGIQSAIDSFRRTPGDAEIVGAQEFYFSLLGLICIIFSWIKLRPLYGMWMTGNWLLATSVTFLQSTPRYTLLLFPIFILFALLGRNRFWYAVVTVWSLLFLGLFSAIFVRGWWAF